MERLTEERYQLHVILVLNRSTVVRAFNNMLSDAIKSVKKEQ